MMPPPDWLVGRWRLLRADPSLEFAPGTRMDFREHGELRYRIPVEGREQEFALLYVVEDDVLRTDNPSAPHATATRFHLGAGGVLVFDFAGALAVFVREEEYGAGLPPGAGDDHLPTDGLTGPDDDAS